MKKAYLASTFVLISAPSLADAPADPGEIRNLPLSGFVDQLSLEQLGNLVVTDTKLAQAADTVTQRIVVLRNEDIERQPAHSGNLAELMRPTSGQFVNVLSRNDANWGSYAGLGPKYNSYLLDGLPIDSFVDAMSLDPSAIERVEVHKGPASVLYSNYLTMDFVGNETPLAGTTNFVLKSRVDTPLTRVAAGAGSWGTVFGKAYAQGTQGNLGYIVSANLEHSDYTQYGTRNSWLQTTQAPAYQKNRFFGNFSYAFDRPDHTVTVFYQRTLHQGTMGRPNRGFDHTYDTLNFAYSNTFSDDWNIQFKYGERRYDRRFANDNYPTDLSLSNHEFTRQTIRPADLTLSHRHWGESLLTAGVDGQWVDYQTDVQDPVGAVTPSNRAQARSTGYFVQEKLVWDAWVLRGGVRHDTIHHDYDLLGGITPATRSAAWSKNLWSFGTRYNADPGLAFYGNVGTSFMAPAAKQIGGTVAVPTASGELPNPGLKPETGVGRDVGVNWRASQALTLDLRGFLNTINDAIVTNIVSAAPSQVRSENAGKARAMGYEVDLRYAASSETSVFGNLTRTHTRVTDPTNADHDGTAIPFAPDTLANAGVLASLPGDMSVATYYHWVGRYYDSTSRSARLGFGQYGVVNVRVQKPLYRDARAAVHLTVDLNNLTDRHHAMPFDFRDPGFNGFAGVDVRY